MYATNAAKPRRQPGTQLAALSSVGLPSDLEAIVQADEDARARVAAASSAARARLEAARQAQERGRREDEARRLRELDEEVARIEANAEKEAGLRQARRATWMEEHERNAEAKRPAAVAIFVRLVGGGP